MKRSDNIDKWLRDNGFEQLIHLFKENEIDEVALLELTEEHLKELDLALGIRIKLIKAIKELSSRLSQTDKSNQPTQLSSKLGRVESSDPEHRQLTVMFCDLVSSTELSSQLDAERFREIILAYQDSCTRVIDRFGGFVARYFGDGILVYFGYPRAHEDDAERAVRAALEVVKSIETLGEELYGDSDIVLAVRVGLATGPVVVGDIIGEGASQQSTALGETPNLAARIQGLAKPNSVVIAPKTRDILAELFTYDFLGEHDLKGILGPVGAWRVKHEGNIDSRFKAIHGQQLTPLVGREEELEILSRRWDRALNCDGQVVLISGEAGIGKSRLVQALIDSLSNVKCTTLRYQCSPYHVNSALFPVIDHLERAAGFTRTDSTSEKLDKLEQILSSSVQNPKSVAALLADLLSIPDECRYPSLKLTPQQQKDQTLAALNDQLFGLASRHPVLVVFEDIHWIDPTTLESLNSMIAQLQNKRILIVFTYRSEFLPPWTGEANVTLLAINKLSQNQSRTMINRVTSGKELPQEVYIQIIDKTDGVPLFVEELTKTVLDSGILREESDHYVLNETLPSFVIPSTLQDSLMARLDRLDSVKDIAQVGAVIGREFNYELIQAIVDREQIELDQSLDKLIETGLVFRRGIPPRATYTFKHALIQDTAYASLLKSRRQSLHATIAATLEQQFPLIVENRPELPAYHYSAAGLTEPAIKYWHQAGMQANLRSANVEASRHLSTALSELNTLPASNSHDRLRLELLVESITPVIAVKGYAGPELESIYRQALSLCDQVGDTPQIYPALYARWVGMLTTGRLPLAQQYGYELLEFAEKRKAEEPTILAWRCIGTVLLMRGNPINSLAYFERVIEALEDREYDDTRVTYSQDILTTAYLYSAIGFNTIGQLDKGKDHALSAIKRAEQLKHAHTLGATYGVLSVGCFALRDGETLTKLSESLSRVVEEHSLSLWACAVRMAKGAKATLDSDYENACRWLLEAIEMFDSFNFKYFRPIIYCFLAESYQELGQYDSALNAIDRGFEEITLGRDSWFEPELHRIKGQTLYRKKADFNQIQDSYQKAISVARSQSAKLFELRATIDLSKYWSQSNKEDEAFSMLQTSYQSFDEKFDSCDLNNAKAQLDILAGHRELAHSKV